MLSLHNEFLEEWMEWGGDLVCDDCQSTISCGKKLLLLSEQPIVTSIISFRVWKHYITLKDCCLFLIMHLAETKVINFSFLFDCNRNSERCICGYKTKSLFKVCKNSQGAEGEKGEMGGRLGMWSVGCYLSCEWDNIIMIWKWCWKRKVEQTGAYLVRMALWLPSPKSITDVSITITE